MPLKKPFSSSEQTIGVPGPYFDDYNGHNNQVPAQVQLKTGVKVYIVLRHLCGEAVLKLFKLDQLARLDLSTVIETPAQRSHLIGCLGREEYTAHIDVANEILSKLPSLFE